MEWYVLNYDFNKKEMEYFNIFRSVNFSRDIENIFKEHNDIVFPVFVEEVDKAARYAFWAKSEYEIMVGDLFNTIERKIDIYAQLKPNMELLAEYILNHRK